MKTSVSSLIGVGLALVVSVVAVYAGVRDHDFVDYDDFAYVVENPRLLSGLNLRGFATDVATPYFGNWSPVTMVSLRINYAAHRLYAPGYLATNVALHAIASVLLLLALLRATGALWPAAFVAGVFAIHPLHVESVAWVSARKDVLSGVFLAATLLVYTRFVERPDRYRKGAVTACVILGLFSKPTMVTLPIVLLLFDYWPLDRLRDPASGRLDFARIRSAVIEKWFWFAAAILVGAVTVLVQDQVGTLELTKTQPLMARLSVSVQSLGVYLSRIFWPVDLAVLYPYEAEYTPSFAVSALISVAITAAAFRFAKTRPYLLMGWMWFGITQLPTIGIVQVGLQAQADRYMYLPLIGPAIAIGWAIRDAPLRGRLRVAVIVPLALGTGLALIGIARTQVDYWRSTVSLFEHTLAVTEGNYLAHKGLGVGYLREGDLERARKHFEKSLQIKPDWPAALLGLGDTARLSGNCIEAVEHYEKAIITLSNVATAQFALGLCYVHLGDSAKGLPHLELAHRLGMRSVALDKALAVARGAD